MHEADDRRRTLPPGSSFIAARSSFPSPLLEAMAMIGEEIMTAHAETQQLREQLLRAQRLSSVGTLASSVAHEFNNILTTIMNYAKLGLKPDSTEAARVQAFEKILKGSQRAATVIASMLGFARN